MISKEEYKKTLIRMWDSVRGDSFKGADTCHGVNCAGCPMKSICVARVENVYELIEFVEEWAKEHPIETNGSRFLKNYPRAEIYDYDNGVDGRAYIRLNRNGLLDDDNCISFPKSWWESEVNE